MRVELPKRPQTISLRGPAWIQGTGFNPEAVKAKKRGGLGIDQAQSTLTIFSGTAVSPQNS
jgi:hypothetical protein